MPDIAACTNDTCQLSDRCYRFNLVPSIMQNVIRFEPEEKLSGVRCDYFYPIEERPVRAVRRGKDGKLVLKFAMGSDEC